jgi:hypothetical protein
MMNWEGCEESSGGSPSLHFGGTDKDDETPQSLGQEINWDLPNKKHHHNVDNLLNSCYLICQTEGSLVLQKWKQETGKM